MGLINNVKMHVIHNIIIIRQCSTYDKTVSTNNIIGAAWGNPFWRAALNVKCQQKLLCYLPFAPAGSQQKVDRSSDKVRSGIRLPQRVEAVYAVSIFFFRRKQLTADSALRRTYSSLHKMSLSYRQ